VAKPADPREPGAGDIPVEFLRGKEEPGGEESEPSNPDHVAHQPRAAETRATVTKGERLFLAGLVVLAVAGGALYLFRSAIVAQYELRFEPERYWTRELDRRSFGHKMSVILHQECLADLLAARVKEPAKVARMKLLGMDESSALKLAREDSESRQEVCKVIADVVKQDRDNVARAEQEVARSRAR